MPFEWQAYRDDEPIGPRMTDAAVHAFLNFAQHIPEELAEAMLEAAGQPIAPVKSSFCFEMPDQES